MTDEFENRLRRALRPVDAPEGFAERLMKRLPTREAPVVIALPVKQPQPERRRLWMPAALAASLAAAVFFGQQMAGHRFEQDEIAAGLAAKQELLQALRVTSRKLDMAYQAVNSPSPETPAAEDEENRT
jgi:hypothetical protein